MHIPQNVLVSFLCYVFSSNMEGGSDHRDYKRIEVASSDESRNKLNKSNGGQI